MEIIDIHLHLTKEQLPQNEKLFISSAENMLPHLEELGITKGILMSSGEGSNTVLAIGNNNECRRITEQFPKIYAWMCNLDSIDEENIYKRLKDYKEQGAVGIGELMINRSLNDCFLQKIFKAAEQLGLPVLFHMSPEEGFQYGVVDEQGLPLLEENLKRYPKLRFIGHSQPFWHEISGDAKTGIEERMAWGEGKVAVGGRLSYLFDTYPNLYGDLSANSGGCAMMRDEAFGLEFMEKYKYRLMFGTDMVNIKMEFPLLKWLYEMYYRGMLGKEAFEHIIGRNAINMFHLDN